MFVFEHFLRFTLNQACGFVLFFCANGQGFDKSIKSSSTKLGISFAQVRLCEQNVVRMSLLKKQKTCAIALIPIDNT